MTPRAGTRATQAGTAATPARATPAQAAAAPNESTEPSPGPGPSPAELRSVDDALPELPEAYGDHRVLLVARDPAWLYCSWDIPARARRPFVKGGQQARITLRLHDVTDVEFDGHNSWSQHHYPLDEVARDWYLPMPVAGRNYLAEVGYRFPDGRFVALGRSGMASAPAPSPSDWQAEVFDYADPGVAPGEPGPGPEAGPPPEHAAAEGTPGAGSSGAGWRDEQARADEGPRLPPRPPRPAPHGPPDRRAALPPTAAGGELAAGVRWGEANVAGVRPGEAQAARGGADAGRGVAAGASVAASLAPPPGPGAEPGAGAFPGTFAGGLPGHAAGFVPGSLSGLGSGRPSPYGFVPGSLFGHLPGSAPASPFGHLPGSAPASPFGHLPGSAPASLPGLGPRPLAGADPGDDTGSLPSAGPAEPTGPDPGATATNSRQRTLRFTGARSGDAPAPGPPEDTKDESR